MNIIVFISSSLAALGLLLGYYYHGVALTERYKAETYQAQIQAMKNEAEEMKKRFEEARLKSLEDMRRFQDESKKIMDTKIAPGCQSAIKFGREQARLWQTLKIQS